jgi:phosphinothricin acetyltransferase
VIRAIAPSDWSAVAEIYEDGIRTRRATFETAAPGWAEWDARHLAAPRLVAEEDGEVLGWAALSPASSRPCYAGVAEVSVYVAEQARGRGVGRALLGVRARRANGGAWHRLGAVSPLSRHFVAEHAHAEAYVKTGSVTTP